MSVSKNFQVTEWASVSQACLTKILGSEQGSFCGRIHHVTALFLCGTLRWRQSFDVCMASKGLLWQLVFSAAGVGHGLKRLGHGNRSNTEHFYRKPHNFRHDKFFNHLYTYTANPSRKLQDVAQTISLNKGSRCWLEVQFVQKKQTSRNARKYEFKYKMEKVCKKVAKGYIISKTCKMGMVLKCKK